MLRSLWLLPLLAACVLTSSASADRVPSRKTQIVPDPGARVDIFVPFLTNGRSTLGVSQGVAPIIVNQPGLGAANDNQLRPVYNLIYYGASKSPNSSFMGAMPREPNQLRPQK